MSDLGSSDWVAGSVILGCGTFGGIGGARHLIGKGLDADASGAVLDEALSLGITMLDTAERYADGISERTIGQWLAAQPSGSTDAVRITTKVAPLDGSAHASFDLAYIEPLFAGSLERLGVERVDWLLTHAQDGATPIEATLEGLEAIRCSGRCDHVGGCNLDASQLRAAIAAADRLGIRGYELVQNGFSLLQPDDGDDVRAICREHELAFTAFSPLAGGVLTGKYRRDQPPPPGSRLALRPDGVDALLTPEVFDAIDVLVDVAAEREVAPGAVALAWLLARDDVTAVITGPATTPPHLQLAQEAMSLELDDSVMAGLTKQFRAAGRR